MIEDLLSGASGFGLDGCRGGWVLASITADGTPDLTLLPRIEALEPVLASRSASAIGPVLIDIPIGLVLSGERPVDTAARRLLIGGASSVFTIPPRCVFDALDFQEAQLLSRAAMGKGFSIQAWNILPKIREVDLWLRRRGVEPAPLCESHPELVFRGLARLCGIEVQALPGKKTADGSAARLEILAACGVNTDALASAPLRSGSITAAMDDMLDALGLAAAARLVPEQLATLPPVDERDAIGLPMAMVVPAVLMQG